MAPRPLHELVEAGWAKALEPAAERIAAMGDFLRAEIAAGRTYLPSGANVLRAFQQPFDDVRVLIVGQDPYPTPGNGHRAEFRGVARGALVAGQSGEHLPGDALRPRAAEAVERRSDAVDAAGCAVAQQGTHHGAAQARRRTGARAGRRSRSRPSGRWRRAVSRWCPSCGGVTRAICGRCSGIFRRSSLLIPRRCRRTAGFSVRVRSAGPMTCWCSKGRSRCDWRLP